MNKKNKTYRDYLANLVRFLAKEDEATYDVDQTLLDAGYEPADLSKKFKDIANQAAAKSPHHWRNRAQKAYNAAKADYLENRPLKKSNRTRSEIMEAISTLLSQKTLKVELAHRNFDNQTDEDLESLLNQLEYLASKKSQDSEE